MVSRWVPLSLILAAGCQTATAPPGELGLGPGYPPAAPLGEAATPCDDVAGELLKSSIAALSLEQRVCCENIANVDTVGYKRRVVRRSSVQIAGQGGDTHTRPTVLEVIPVFTTGATRQTQRALDVAIDGEGFFAVTMPDGSRGFTRDGQFRVNADGKLVIGRGRIEQAEIVLPAITVPQDTLEITIDPVGRVGGRTAGSPDLSTSFGRLTLHRFVSPEGLRPEGHLWRPTPESGPPVTGRPGLIGLGTLKQGFLERSNVDLPGELLTLQLLEKRLAALVAVMQRYGLTAP